MDAVGDNAPDDATLLRCDDDGLVGFVMRNKPDDAFVLSLSLYLCTRNQEEKEIWILVR